MSLSTSVALRRMRNLNIKKSQEAKDDMLEEKERILTESQKRALMAAFKTYEKAGKNKISVKDFGALVRSLGWNPSEIDIEQARHELDIRGNGSIEYGDLEVYVARKGMMIEECSAQDVQAAFHVLDTAGTGCIPSSDFRHFLMTMGEKMTEEEVADFLATTDKEGRGAVSFKDIVSAIEDTEDDT